MKKLLALLLVLLVLTGGCAATSKEALSPENDYSYSYDKSGGMTTQESASSSDTDSTLEAAAGRKLVYTVSMTMETLTYDDTLPALKARCTSAGGYIESASETGVNLYSTGTRRATLTMRIPAANLDAFIDDALLMGNVTSNEKSTQDITDSYFDTEAHLETLQIQEQRYLALLEKADSMEDIITIEQALSDVRYQIESLTGTLQKYDSLVDYSTVTVYLQEVKETTQAEPENFWQRIGTGFVNSVKALWKFVKWCAVALVTVLPFLVIPGLITWLVLWLVRRRKLKRAKAGGNDQPNIK